MSENLKTLNYRMYLVAFLLFLFSMLIVFKLTRIQWVEGDYYREQAKKHDVKSFVVPANRGNIYSSDGSLLAVSVPIYIVRFDPLSPSTKY